MCRAVGVLGHAIAPLSILSVLAPIAGTVPFALPTLKNISFNDDGRLVGISITDDKGVSATLSRHVYNADGQLDSSTTFVNGKEARVLAFKYTSDVCIEQLWTEPEDAIVSESSASKSLAP